MVKLNTWVLIPSNKLIQCHEAKTSQNANGHFESPIDFFDQSFYKVCSALDPDMLNELEL